MNEVLANWVWNLELGQVFGQIGWVLILSKFLTDFSHLD